MNVLAFDTCMTACSAAVFRGSTSRLHRRFAGMERGHSEALFPMVAAVMAEAELDFGDIDRIAVTSGPGTFTGVRAGIAAARGFALACGAPVVAATSLEVMALSCLDQLGPGPCAQGFLIAHDARRGELYVQMFDGEANATSEPLLASPAGAASLAGKALLVAGSGARLVAVEAERNGAAPVTALPDLLPDAGYLAQLALEREPSAAPVSPLYLRAPDAKPQMDNHLARI